MADPWETRLEKARSALAPFAPLLGTWEGRGTVHGEATVGQMVIRSVLEDTAIEVRERTGDYEDISFYRWDPETGQLRVLHLSPASLDDHPVEPTGEGLVWVTAPDAPAVEWRLESDGFSCLVVWPRTRHVEVDMRYRRAG